MKYSFLTHQQMSDVYDERQEQGTDKELYTLDLTSDSQQLIFCGSRHVNNPEDKQYKEIESLWSDFLTLPGKKIAMCEGNIREVSDKSRDEAIFTNGDAGSICWLANQSDIEVVSPEPDRNLEVRSLVKEFGPEKTILYYFDRQMHQWARADFRHHGNIREYILGFLDRFPTEELEGLEVSPNTLYDIFEKETGKPFSFLEIRTIYDFMAPASNEVASASSLYRNESIYEAIKHYKDEDYHVFVVYGSGHAIVLEPALRELYTNE